VHGYCRARRGVGAHAAVQAPTRLPPRRLPRERQHHRAGAAAAAALLLPGPYTCALFSLTAGIIVYNSVKLRSNSW
jgi:hypothetical protein